ncbi:MAG: hypothetical protein WC052_06255 [Patescibacteria group bacterium]
MTPDIFVVSDIFKAGVTEDGEDYTGLRYFVMAEFPSGQRWVHHERYDTTHVMHDEDGMPYFPDRSRVAVLDVERLCACIKEHVAAGRKLNTQHWRQVDPRYGSGAYQDLDAQGYFRARELNEAELNF